MNKTYVLGHSNPDTDSIASAIAYAWVLSQRDEGQVIAARIGPLNPQTAWLLERLGYEAPELLADAAPRFGDVARRLDSVTPDEPLGEAWSIATRTGSVAPVVEADGRPLGLVTGLSLFRLLAELVGPQLMKQEMKLSELFATPCREVVEDDVPRFEAGARISEALPRILRDERDDFWVVDDDGRYLGVCRKPDLIAPPRLQLVLVDHNEMGQSIGFLDEATILEVLDHHRLDNPPTRMPIRFHVDPVGSTCTLVFERIEEQGFGAPPRLAGLLLGGLISDTLMLRSPTTTERDHRAATRLSKWAFVGGGPLAGEELESFGMALLESGAGLTTRPPGEVVSADLKSYEAAGLRFGVAQVEVIDLVELTGCLEELRGALEELRGERHLDFALLMVTDIVCGTSRLVAVEIPTSLDALPFTRLDDGTFEARGVVSRKKQLLPLILTLLEGK